MQGDEQRGTWDLWALPLLGDRKPFPVVQSPFNETHGQFSPDGRWIVYASDESGIREIYVRPFSAEHPSPTTNGKRVQITFGGGSQPRWRGDGRELFYLSQDNQLMAVAVKSGIEFESGRPRPMFQVRGTRPFHDYLYEYDVTPDGQHFLFNLSREGTVSPLTVVVNWNSTPN
jgi:eukaryotic-like serine/threonine-protein kinase